MWATIWLIIAGIQVPVPLSITRPRSKLIKAKILKLISIMRRHRKLLAEKSSMNNGGCSFVTQPSRWHRAERSQGSACLLFPTDTLQPCPSPWTRSLMTWKNSGWSSWACRKTSRGVSLVCLNLLTPQPDEFLIVERKENCWSQQGEGFSLQTKFSCMVWPRSTFQGWLKLMSEQLPRKLEGMKRMSQTNDERTRPSCSSNPALLSSLCYHSSSGPYMSNWGLFLRQWL